MQESIYDRFVEKVTERARRWKVGHSFDADVDQGPQVLEGVECVCEVYIVLYTLME